MIDMHCHILPGIDDGARSEAESMELLRAEKEQGVDRIVFTPHFYPERTPLGKFLRRREQSYDRLRNSPGFSELGIETKLGAEVCFSVKLVETDVSGLCFEGTNYILIELPVSNKPFGLTHTLQNLLERGYTPILAHVERCGYFTQDPTLLYDIVMLGCAAQVNASSVINGSWINGVSALRYISWELAHIICSDAHSTDTRRPNTKAAYERVKKKLGESYADWLAANSTNIYNDRLLDIPMPHKPKKFLGRWR